METAAVQLTQYTRPYGHRRSVSVHVPSALAEAAADLALSCEVLTTGQIAIYGRWKDEDADEEYLELANNRPGPCQPDEVTAHVIQKVLARRNISVLS